MSPRKPAAPRGEAARRALLASFRNPAPERDYEIEHSAPEFTSVCPITGQPDFATIVVRYVPDRLCVELKSLKLYLQSFRSTGVFYEALVNRILDDLVAATSPRRMEVRGEFRPRGGISSVVVARHPDAPAAPERSS